MPQEVIVIAVHGMGDTKPKFANGLEQKLTSKLGSSWDHVYFDSVYYQEILQPNQERVFKEIRKQDLDWMRIRKFLLYGFSDAAGLERNSSAENSPYHKAQAIIKETLKKAYDFIGAQKPVIVVAHSLGCQVLSNYIWDSQQNAAKQGIWRHDPPIDDPKLKSFLRLKSMKYFYTTGCNIPIFIAGFPRENIIPVNPNKPGYAFRWKNFYDQDDVLGWPLKPLSPAYKAAVFKDIEVNAGGSFFGNLTQGWNPLSHNKYWEDPEIINALTKDIRSLLS